MGGEGYEDQPMTHLGCAASPGAWLSAMGPFRVSGRHFVDIKGELRSWHFSLMEESSLVKLVKDDR
jgi:hypothetical protein